MGRLGWRARRRRCRRPTQAAARSSPKERHRRVAHDLMTSTHESRTAMNALLSYDLARQVERERQLEAVARSRAARLRSARRWQRRAEEAAYQARLARLAVQ